MESMYQAMEGEIYARYNVEMKRMVLKYRETEKLLKKTNEKITTYADVIDLDRKLREKEREYQKSLTEMKEQRDRAFSSLEREQ